MADHGTETAETRKRDAERAARIVLAKHPCVIPGSGPTEPRTADTASFTRTIDTGVRAIGRGLSHGDPAGPRRS